MWESSAGGLGTRRHPWAQTDAMAEDGGVGCPERGRGGSGQKCRHRGGSSKRKHPDRQARGKAKEKGRRETGGRGQGGRQPEIARASPGEGGPRSHGSGPTRQGCGRHATGRLRSAVSLEKHCEPAAAWRGAAGAAYRFSESRRRGGAPAPTQSRPSWASSSFHSLGYWATQLGTQGNHKQQNTVASVTVPLDLPQDPKPLLPRQLG